MATSSDVKPWSGAPQRLPSTGVAREALRRDLEAMQAGDMKWREGRVFGIYFPTRPDIEEVAEWAYRSLFRLSTHHPEVFPSVQTLERDVVAMAAGLFNADQAIGNVTSGGTESVLLALKAARDRARVERGISAPEAVVPLSAYPAFAKAGDLLGVEVRRVALDPRFRADLRAVRSAITANTVFMAASVPTITHGVVDPVTEMAAMAGEHGIHFHVDASLGGFQLPFLGKLGHRVPQFDFRVPGVTSLSADLHKYAYVPMGASVLLYRDAGAYAYQPSRVGDWVGGTYSTPGLLGSRSAGGIAASWAVMRYLGEQGYLELTRLLWETTQRLAEGIARLPGLRLVAHPETAVLVFGSDTVDMARLQRAMESRGWSGRPQADPPSIRLLVAPYHSQVADAYLEDLRASLTH
jgi:glutamate/tyrosine decarboxylase-like PLP-dependent enzyme